MRNFPPTIPPLRQQDLVFVGDSLVWEDADVSLEYIAEPLLNCVFGTSFYGYIRSECRSEKLNGNDFSVHNKDPFTSRIAYCICLVKYFNFGRKRGY